MGKHGVTHKTGSASLSEDDRDTATVNMYRIFPEVLTYGF